MVSTIGIYEMTKWLPFCHSIENWTSPVLRSPLYSDDSRSEYLKSNFQGMDTQILAVIQTHRFKGSEHFNALHVK